MTYDSVSPRSAEDSAACHPTTYPRWADLHPAPSKDLDAYERACLAWAESFCAWLKDEHHRTLILAHGPRGGRHFRWQHRDYPNTRHRCDPPSQIIWRFDDLAPLGWARYWLRKHLERGS